MGLLSENSVVDNLDSDEKKRPLSARSGRVLRSMIESLSKHQRIYDSGWIDLSDSMKQYGLYEPYISGQPPRIRRYGDIVYLYAEVRKILGSTAQPGGQGNVYPAFKVPDDMRPDHDVRVICQGSGMRRAVARVLPDGTFTFDRFGITTADPIPQNTWLAVNMSWMVGGVVSSRKEEVLK